VPNPLTPTPKAAAAGLAGIVASFVVWILTDGFHISVSPEHAALIAAAMSFIAAYFSPRSQPPPTT